MSTCHCVVKPSTRGEVWVAQGTTACPQHGYGQRYQEEA